MNRAVYEDRYTKETAQGWGYEEEKGPGAWQGLNTHTYLLSPLTSCWHPGLPAAWYPHQWRRQVEQWLETHR